jgi:Amidohydrolase family
VSDFDLIIRSEDDIGISQGKIVARGKNLAGSATSEIEATSLTILPGAIDAHVHFNEPGRTDWEGFATGSRAAAAGGTTTIFDMPLNAHPPTIDGESFDAKRVAAEQSSLVDFALWGGLVPGNLAQLETLRERGVVGLKAFMCESGINDFPSVDHATLRAGMKRAAEIDLLVAVHAESSELLAAKSKGETVRDFLASRPPAPVAPRCSGKNFAERDHQTNECRRGGTFSHFRQRRPANWQRCRSDPGRFEGGGSRARGGVALSPSPHPLSRPKTARAHRPHDPARSDNLRKWSLPRGAFR